MIAWAVDTLIGTSLIMLLVLAARQPVASWFGASWAYALWLLPLLRFFLPPLGLFDTTMPQETVIIVPAVTEAIAPASAESASQWIFLLLALWAGGAAVFVSWQQAAYGALMLSLGRDGRPSRPPEYGGIRVVESESADGPMAVGFLNRRIVVPLDFATRYNEAERSLALDHELVHHRRGDLWWNLAALIVLTLNWFNPIAHFAFRAFRADQELACDASVAARITANARHDYARALVKSASRPGQIATCPMYHADQLKRRLAMITQHRVSLARSLGGSVALIALVAAGIAVGSPGFAREARPPMPRVFVAASGENSPLISDADIATLQEKCGEEGATVTNGSPILCGNGKEVDDPEVRRIVETALERADVEVKKAEQAAEAATAVAAQAAEQAARAVPADLAEQMAEAGHAIARAHAEVARIDVHAIHAAVAAAVVPAVHIKTYSKMGLSAEERAEIAEAMAEARTAMAEARIDQAELRRELREAEVERREALREAAEERRQALLEAAEERREADVERRRELAEAARERSQALREAEAARREALRHLERDRDTH